MILEIPDKIIVENVDFADWEQFGVKVNVLRLDLIDPISGGNKWFKLKYNIENAVKSGINRIVTFGGAFSNHIAAIGEISKLFPQIEFVILVRGEISNQPSITLKRLMNLGVSIEFVSRANYRDYRNLDNHKIIFERFGNCLIIPEGGGNVAGVLGCSYIPDFIPMETDTIFLPVATATTLAGLAISPSLKANIYGIGVLNGTDFLAENADKFISEATLEGKNYSLDVKKPRANSWKIDCSFASGGYAKVNSSLIHFVEHFKKSTEIPIEPIYTGKMFYGIDQLIRNGFLEKGSIITAIHTGGMQYLMS